jgi:CubicO group peptidase (beta-lactamase class C family)
METREPVTADALFHLASVSKTFVATGIIVALPQH